MSKFLGYTFLEDGKYYEPVELNSDDINQIAHFICDDRVHNKMITDESDEAVVSTIGEFLDRVDKDRIDFKLLQSECIKLQYENEKASLSEEDQEKYHEEFEK